MKDFEVRAWHIDEKKYVDIWNMTPDGKRIQIADQLYLVNNLDASDEHKKYLEENGIAIRNEFILQLYTGKRDKNGVKIFEGDVVSGESGVGVVKCDSGLFFIRIPGDIIPYVVYKNAERVTVIGKVLENPELLNTN